MLRVIVHRLSPSARRAALALLVAALLAPPPARSAGPANVEDGPLRLAPARVLWETPLDGAPSSAPRAVRTTAGVLLLGGGPAGVEAHASSDGVLAWRVPGLARAGLGSVAERADGRTLVGWSGIGTDGAPALVLLDLETGRPSARFPLPAAPVGPPLLDPSGGAEAWLVPLGEGRVAAISVPSGDLALLAAPAPIRPPLLEGPDRPLAVSGSPPALRDLLGRPHRVLATGLAPRTVATGGTWLYGASGRTFCGHACRMTRRGRLRCARRWCQVLGADVVAPPLILPGLVVTGARDTFAYAFRDESGHLAWRTRVGQRVEHRPLAWRGAAIVVPVSGRAITALDVRDGRVAGTVDAGRGETFAGGGAVAGDTLAVVVERPPDVSVLRAYGLARAEPPKDDQPDEDAAASSSSPRSAARNRSSSMR